MPQITNPGSTTIATGITNLDRIIKWEGTSRNTTSLNQITIPYVAAGSDPATVTPYNIDVAYIHNTNSLRINVGNNRRGVDCYVTIYYTKTS